MVAPYIEGHIDFDEDGIFQDDEEISSYISSFQTQKGYDKVSRMPRSTMLTLTLNNDDHDFSPTNTSGAFYPFQLPGPNVRIRCAYPLDRFGGSDGDALQARQMPLATDQALDDPNHGTWAADASFEIRSNHIELTAAGARIATIDQPDTWGLGNKLKFGAKIQRESGTIVYPYKQSLFVYRYADDNNYSEIALEQTNSSSALELKFNKVVGGSLSAYGASLYQNDLASIWAAGAKARVEVQLYNLEIIVWVDDHVASVNQLQTTGLNNTKYGIGGEKISSNGVSGTVGSRLVQWEDFGGWGTQFVGRVDLIAPNPDPTIKKATITAFDDLERARLDLVLRSTAITSAMEDAATDILTAIGIPPTKWIMDNDNIRLNQKFQMGMSRDGYTELVQVANDWVGRFWVDGHGCYRIEDHDHRTQTPHTNNAWYVRDTDTSGSIIGMMSPIVWEDGNQLVENEIFYRYFRVTANTAATVWQLEVDDNPVVDFSRTPVSVEGTLFQQTDIGAIGQEANAIDFLVAVPGTDWSCDENSDGTGVDWVTPILSESGGTVSMAGDLSSLDEPGQRFDQSTTLGGTVWKRSQGYIVISDNNGNRILAKCEDTNPDGDGSRVNLTNGGEADSGSDYYIYKDTGFSTANTPLTYDVYIGAAYVIPGYEGNFVILRVMINDDINDFASKSAYITSAQAVATQHVSSSQATSRSIDSASLLRYGRRPIDHAAQHIDTLFWARIQSDKRLALRGTQKSRLKYASNANYDYSNLWHSIWSELGDRIGLFYSEMGLTGKDYFLESQTTLVRDGGHVISSDTEGLET